MHVHQCSGLISNIIIAQHSIIRKVTLSLRRSRSTNDAKADDQSAFGENQFQIIIGTP